MSIALLTSFSSQGWQNSETFLERMRKLVALLKSRGIQFPIILEVDGHSTRYNLDFIQFCFDNDV